jgi:hypothetical protein
MWIEYVLNGKRKEVRDIVGKRLIAVKAAREVQGEYLTRDMGQMPEVQKDGDGLDDMDKAQLHALAKERGLQLHHMLGAEKVRAALRGESEE